MEHDPLKHGALALCVLKIVLFRQGAERREYFLSLPIRVSLCDVFVPLSIITHDHW